MVRERSEISLAYLLGPQHKYTYMESLFLSLDWKAVYRGKVLETQVGIHSPRSCFPFSLPGSGLGMGVSYVTVSESRGPASKGLPV